jgi:hypothetical protein
MTPRAMSGIAAAVLIIVLACSGLATTVMGNGSPATAGCLPAADTPRGTSMPEPGGGGHAPIGRWSSEQVGNAAIIIAAGQDQRVAARGWVIAVATAMQESLLINAPGGADDSVDLFQQRPSQGWGTPAQLHDPAYSAATFYHALLTVDGWQSMPLTEAAQTVRLSE